MRISDWSSCVCSADRAPVARVVAHAAHAHGPGLFTTAPVPAMKKLLAKAGWTVGDVDLFEVNEAFAVVAMIAMQELSIPHDKLNVNGGATRSEERRGGKECVSTFRSRWSPDNETNKKTKITTQKYHKT